MSSEDRRPSNHILREVGRTGGRRGSGGSLENDKCHRPGCAKAPCPCRLIGKAARGAAHCMVGTCFLCGPKWEYIMANDDMVTIDRGRVGADHGTAGPRGRFGRDESSAVYVFPGDSSIIHGHRNVLGTARWFCRNAGAGASQQNWSSPRPQTTPRILKGFNVDHSQVLKQLLSESVSSRSYY